MAVAPARSDARDPLGDVAAAMSALPSAIFAEVATSAVGTLADRAEGVRLLHAALGRGQVPAVHETPWPSPRVRAELYAWLKTSGLAARCAESPELADEVTLSVLHHAAAADRFGATEADRLRAELEAIEAARERRNDGSPELRRPRDGLALERETEARQLADVAAARHAADRIAAAWHERLRAWDEIEEVFGELAATCGLGRDVSRTVLRHTGWRDARRLAELIEKLPQIRDVVRTLGRMQSADKPDESPVLERLLGPVRRALEQRRDVDTPVVPHDTRGVERSGEIARMLPSEAILFMRPALRLLWHSRRAERSLATYRVRGTHQERLVDDDTGTEARDAERHKRKRDRGPIIVCLDTSGSMKGAPETVAKAITLEALRIAGAERRECFLYAFGGPAQVVEFDLSLERGGVQALLEFLGCSFHGGTDVAEPIARALRRVEAAKWSRADVIVISDGEFPLPGGTMASIATARDSLQLRVHGLLVGAVRSSAMSALCDPIHVFRDWNALARGRGF